MHTSLGEGVVCIFKKPVKTCTFFFGGGGVNKNNYKEDGTRCVLPLNVYMEVFSINMKKWRNSS